MTKQICRCAIYTRKSSDEGLDQEFNSLDAQREAGEAYVKSQASEGWHLLPARYDDGGFSGGSMGRPALKRLLEDVEAGLIDVVVVYKIDRLTRSLADFARMVELFDKQSVSFVSVTQSFNTTSSMGRLTLNVLLSFAQFEREVTGERIRDKIAASKAKGMWMGGLPPLGYDPPTNGTRALQVNEREAETVRLIFHKYLELASVHALQRWLDAQAIRSKRRVSASGRVFGDQPVSRGALFHLLRNRAYIGNIVHGKNVYPGQHFPIVDAEMFEAVQLRLDAQVRRHKESPRRVAQAALTGRIFDAHGEPMSPTFSYGAGGKVYRYYVSSLLQQGARRNGESESIPRAPGAQTESFVADLVRRLVPLHGRDPLTLLKRLEVHSDALHLLMPEKHVFSVRSNMHEDEHVQVDQQQLLRVIIPVRMKLRSGRTWVCNASAPAARHDPALIKALRSAHRMLKQDGGPPAINEVPRSPYERHLLRLAFLAPDIQKSILEGRQPEHLTLEELRNTPIPLLWSDQRQKLGFV